jgi:hypothetical protein
MVSILITKSELKNLYQETKVYKLKVKKLRGNIHIYDFDVLFNKIEKSKGKSIYRFTFLDIINSPTTNLSLNKYNETWSLYKEVSSDLELKLISILDSKRLQHTLTLNDIKKREGLTLDSKSKRYNVTGKGHGKIFTLITANTTLSRLDDTYNEVRVKIYQISLDTFMFIQYKSTYEVSPSYIIYTCLLRDYKKTWALFDRE